MVINYRVVNLILSGGQEVHENVNSENDIYNPFEYYQAQAFNRNERNLEWNEKSCVK